MTKAKAKPLSRNPLRSVVARFCLFLTRQRMRNTAVPARKVPSRRRVAASVIAAGVAQRYTLTICVLSFQKRKSKALLIATLTVSTRTRAERTNVNAVIRTFTTRPSSLRGSRRTATETIPHAADEYTPVSDAIRNAVTNRNAATIPRAYALARPSITAYQPRMKMANRRTGYALRSEGSQKTITSNSSSARFQAGWRGSSKRSIRYTKTKPHHAGTVTQVA